MGKMSHNGVLEQVVVCEIQLLKEAADMGATTRWS
jgi:hypothetical protein